MSNRENWIDIAKGLSIILVVIGHSGHLEVNHFLAWFRMPFFFFVSGLIFKYAGDFNYKAWSRIQMQKLLIPYASYGILFILSFLVFHPSIDYLLHTSIQFLYGGKILEGAHLVFWFITCLLLTRLFFGYVLRYTLAIQVSCIGGGYVLAHLLAACFPDMAFPLNMDVALVTAAYFAAGYYCKTWIKKWMADWKVLLVCFLISSTFLALDYFGVFIFQLDLKYRIFHHIFLDLIIPLSFVLLLLSVCVRIASHGLFGWISRLGVRTVTIMYLHVPVNMFIAMLFDLRYGVIPYTIIGIGIPLLIGVLFQKSSILSFLFLARLTKSQAVRKKEPFVS
ncbi:acyltransferase family protein [Terribacillus sp. 7520-G]|uniref:acyltransferase family protein n=1 Tax=unclassified Terribacillus TaxID=2636508 RepID=UPI000BA7D2B1|nr:acyltransferase family protein [Terribacillus sp. 7520-G]PAD40412.1 hypothetical protein CHH53_00210 [Terribacillus sp. 7520-G]